MFVSTSLTSSFGSGDASGLGVGSLAGYQWMWPNGFNINLGGGIVYYAVDAEIKLDGGGTAESVGLSGVQAAADVTLGYAF